MLPEAVRGPATVKALFAAMGAFAVMGPDIGPKVVTALICKVCPPALVPTTAFPVAVRVPATVTSELAKITAFAVMGPADVVKVVTALTVRLCPPEA